MLIFIYEIIEIFVSKDIDDQMGSNTEHNYRKYLVIPSKKIIAGP